MAINHISFFASWPFIVLVFRPHGHSPYSILLPKLMAVAIHFITFPDTKVLTDEWSPFLNMVQYYMDLNIEI